jgi:hypothetical protein
VWIERGHRDHRQRGDGDDDEAADQPARLAAGEEAAPGRGEAELGLEEGDAQPEAADDQRGGGRLVLDLNLRGLN